VTHIGEVADADEHAAVDGQVLELAAGDDLGRPARAVPVHEQGAFDSEPAAQTSFVASVSALWK
jgi:hypothetical protein